jgi:hypothetical protein
MILKAIIFIAVWVIGGWILYKGGEEFLNK